MMVKQWQVNSLVSISKRKETEKKMKPEELLKTLKEGGLDDKAIKDLLDGTLALLKGDDDTEKEERAEASKLLGVEL